MLKKTNIVKIQEQAAEVLRNVLAEVPAIERLEIHHESTGNHSIGLLIQLNAFGSRHTLLAYAQPNGQPRHVRSALLMLKDHLTHQREPITQVLIAPYLSPETQRLCQEHGVSFLDLQGNARLVFGTFFISRQVAGKPPSERRELRSLFKPKSAQMLRQMLLEPRRPWRVAELAEAAGISLGHASNIRAALLEREWAHVSREGVSLSAPGVVLDTWCEAYEPPAGKQQAFYTTLHGVSLVDAIRTLRATTRPGQAMLASFSAAQWLAPYARVGTHHFYADEAGLEKLCSTLQLSPSHMGENVFVTVLDESDLFRDALEPSPGVFCTGLVQTYLDLAHAGERGQEAAQHLRQERLKWPT